MQLLKISLRALALGTLVTGLISCNEQSREYVSDFKMAQSFSFKTASGEPVTLNKGDQGDGWYVVLGTDNDGKEGIALMKEDQSVAIPFGIGQQTSIDSDAPVSSSITGQGVSLQFVNTNSSSVDTTPRHSTQNCTVTSTEHVCDNSSGQYKCFDRTVSRSGSQDVTTTSSGSNDYMQLKIISAKGNLIATLDYSVDNTSNNNSQGTCN
jgi:hypothetical protein